MTTRYFKNSLLDLVENLTHQWPAPLRIRTLDTWLPPSSAQCLHSAPPHGCQSPGRSNKATSFLRDINRLSTPPGAQAQIPMAAVSATSRATATSTCVIIVPSSNAPWTAVPTYPAAPLECRQSFDYDRDDDIDLKDLSNLQIANTDLIRPGPR